MNTTKYLYMLLLCLMVSGGIWGQETSNCNACLGYSHEAPDEIITIKIKHPGKQTYSLESAARYGNTVVYAGDIVVTYDYYGEMLTKGNISSDFSARWANSTIPYEFGTGLLPFQINRILSAIEDVNNQTNLCVVERTNESSYIIFQDTENRCYVSDIGDTGQSGQIVNIGDDCSKGTVIHEILHKAGVYHEQTRPDRDQYIVVNWANLDDGWAYQFQMQGPETSSGSYDFGSIMHYPEYHDDVTINDNEPAFYVINPNSIPSGVTIGQRDDMSSGDIFAVNSLYPNPCGSEPTSAPSNDECSNAVTLTTDDCISGDVAGATQSYPPTVCTNGLISDTAYDVWYEFTAQNDTAIIIIQPSLDFDPVIGFYENCSSNGFWGCVDQAGGAGDTEYVIAVGLNIGETYYVRIYNYEQNGVPPNTTDFDVCLVFPDDDGGSEGDTEHDFYIEDLSTDKEIYEQGETIVVDCRQYTSNEDGPYKEVDVQFTVRHMSGSIIDVLGSDYSTLGDGDDWDNADINATLSNNLPSTVQICAEANYNNAIPETNTNNNLSCVTINISGGNGNNNHDFFITDLSTDAESYQLGDAIEVYSRQNTNNPDGPEVDVIAQYTIRNINNNLIEELGTRESGLGNGDESDGEPLNTTLPNNLPSNVQICAEANYNNAVPETNTSNNLSCITIQIIENSNPCESSNLSIDATIQYEYCNQSNGWIEVQGNGGTAPYNFIWNDGTTGLLRNNLSAGTYNVTITDAQACTDTKSFTLDNVVADILISEQITNANCNTQGSISLNPTGGQIPYAYTWSNGQTSNSIIANADTYNVTVTDADGCMTNDSFTIASSGTAITLSIQSTNANCDNLGSAIISTSGGQAPFTYLWSDGLQGENRSDLPIDTYTITVTDANGCTAQQSVTIAGGGGPLNLVEIGNPSTCEGGTGSALVSTTGGDGNYTFTWSNGADTPQINNLSPGNYTATVTDSNGCSGVTSVEIADEEFSIDCIIPQNATCGVEDGEVLVKTLNETGALTYVWSNGATTNPATGLDAGGYSVTITDANGCTITANTYINYDVPTYEIITIPISCAGESDGAVEVYPLGGAAPYTFDWSNGATGPYLTNLEAGTYNVMISDANGCNTNRSVTLEAPQAMSANLYVASNGCSIITNVNGGTAPYAYLWENGETTTDLHEIQGDTTYHITITDANGCTHTDSLYTPTSTGMPDASFEYTIENNRLMLAGNPNATNEWLVDNKWSSNIVNPQFPATPGTMVMVHCTITNDCGSVTVTEMIQIPDSMTALDENELLTGINISPNPFHDYILIDMGVLRGEFELRIYNALGQVVFTQNERVTDTQLSINPTIGSAGIYHLSIIEKDTQRIFTQKIVKVQ